MNKSIRDSNIELLRIFSMFYIVIYHFLSHSILPSSPHLAYILKPIISILHIGVICFVLISGYWRIKFSLKGFARLFIQCSFYSILIYLIFLIINPGQFNIRNLIWAILPFQWWFIKVYFCLYLLAPIINIPLNTESKNKKLIFLILLGIVAFVFGQFTPSLADGKNPINFIFVYYLGDFIRNNLSFDFKQNLFKLFGIYIVFNFFVFISIFISFEIPLVNNILFNRIFYPYHSIGLILNATLFFMFFCGLSIKSKFINWISVSILPVYLLHENPYLGVYLYDFVLYLKSEMQSPFMFSLALFFLALLVIMVCVLVDKIVNPVIKWIEGIVIHSKYFDKINNLIELSFIEKSPLTPTQNNQTAIK